MRLFHCAHCANLVYFENHQCVRCGHVLAFVPELQRMTSLDPARDDTWRTPDAAAQRRRFRLCQNYVQHHVCNWALDADSPETLCRACRLTRVIPELGVPGNQQAWYKLEVAKRRVLQNLTTLGLPWTSKREDPASGLAFEFLADAPDGSAPVMTGHAEGVITLALAEADDAERERRRLQMHEPFRTLVGHFRHELGHYYWDRLVRDAGRLDAFRENFGDERADYSAALEAHYQNGAPADWRERFVSAYASAHPWEDWAETWAHYLHMVDTLETAEACGVRVTPPDQEKHAGHDAFGRMMDEWFALTHMLNNLTRSLGQNDAYPFVLSTTTRQKIRFVHDLVGEAASNQGAA